MATELKFPDTLANVEGATLSRWLVKVGDAVKAGDPVAEVATDKVDTEIQAPADGVITQLNFGEGEVLPVNPVLALIGEPGTPAVLPPQEGKEVIAPPQAAGRSATPVARRIAGQEGVDLAAVQGSGPGGQVTKEDVLAHVAAIRASRPPAGAAAAPIAAGGVNETGQAPLAPSTLPVPSLADTASLVVQRLAAEHNVNLRELAAGRPLGSLTKYDVLGAIASRQAGRPVVVPVRAAPAPAPAATIAPPAPPPRAAQAAKVELQPGDQFVPHTRMRTLVARNTTQSAFSIPHVTTMWDVDMSAVLAHRREHKAGFAAAGVNLTLTAYFVQAVIAGLKAVPAANSTWTDEGLIIRKSYHIGVAVALPPDQNGIGGLIVPVLKNAADLSLLGIARAVNDLAERARRGQLQPDDLQGGTFTLTNYGTSGSRFQTPVILPGQAGILGVGAVEKRPVVVSRGHPLEANAGDSLAFLPMTTLGFSYDHRVLDGASADAFCAAVKEALEKWA